tara:strand:+ start:343 stop:777 length:435 start_codon:yes stop_codon:yes gene_type:complete
MQSNKSNQEKKMNIQIENGIDRNTCQQLRESLEDLLKPIIDSGLDFKIGNIKYDNVTMDVKIEFYIKEGKEDKDKDMANQWLEIKGANFRIGDVFIAKDEEWIVSGFNPKAKKYPVTITRKLNGDTYKNSVEGINAYFAIQENS